MTLILDLDLDILKTYLRNKNEVSTPRLSKVRTRIETYTQTHTQTDIKTDVTEYITTPQSRVVIKNNKLKTSTVADKSTSSQWCIQGIRDCIFSTLMC